MNIPVIVLLVINYCVLNSFYLFVLLLYQEYNKMYGHIFQKFDLRCFQLELHCLEE